jgi:hypothetical protein
LTLRFRTADRTVRENGFISTGTLSGDELTDARAAALPTLWIMAARTTDRSAVGGGLAFMYPTLVIPDNFPRLFMFNRGQWPCATKRKRTRGASEPIVKVVDLYCGIGGLTHGLVLEGFDVVAGVDNDISCKYAFEKTTERNSSAATSRVSPRWNSIDCSTARDGIGARS